MKIFILVTLHAGLVRDPGLNLGHIHNMGWMAGGASGNDGGILLPQFTLDDFCVGLLNPCMTFHAGTCNPVCRNRRIGTGMGKHQVVAVTIVTGGSNNQSGFKQAPAMNPLGIVLNNIVLGDIIYPGHYFALFVASTTKEGDVHLIGTRFGIAVM